VKTMKALKLKLPVMAVCLLGASSPLSGARVTSPIVPRHETKSPPPIAWAELGAKAGAQYQGDGLAIVRSERGAVLRCVFQKLEGHATTEGLWFTSTAPDTPKDRFRVVPCSFGRDERKNALEEPLQSWIFDLERWTLAPPTSLEVESNLVRFIRPGLVEEYSVSMDGIRQDFVITQRPAGAGELRLELEVAGAQVEPTTHGARLVLDHSGRKISYSRLQVQDAQGGALSARIEVVSPHRMAVLVEDEAAVYPVRIDPTFSDDNWISLSPSILGTDGSVRAAVADGSGNLYIGGVFRVVGDVIANGIARWNGSSWSVLGSGVDGGVSALAVSGGDLYAGGWFTTAGGNAATNIAKWNGSSWSALGSGVDGDVWALAMSGSDLYAGGSFTTAGGIVVNHIAKWEQLVGLRFGDRQHSPLVVRERGRAGGVGQRPVCRGQFRRGGWAERRAHC